MKISLRLARQEQNPPRQILLTAKNFLLHLTTVSRNGQPLKTRAGSQGL
nr:MAG TPA: hypothetical protein [Caudoviricetes sp.]